MINTRIQNSTSLISPRVKRTPSRLPRDLRPALVASIGLLIVNLVLVAFHSGPPVTFLTSRNVLETTPASYQTPPLARSNTTTFQPPPISLLFVGDVMLGRQVNIISAANNDPNWPFLQTASLLQSADLTIGNLEAPLVEDCPFSSSGMQLCGRPHNAAGLHWAGFDVIGLANNHALDYGEQGLADSLAALNSYGLAPVRDDRTAIINIRGVRVGILAFEDTFMHPLDTQNALQIIASSTSKVDIQIVMMHWGEEYQAHPTDRQVALGRLLVDSGVDVVIGAHPHWTQPVEEYAGGLIFYSLGNFVFDQMWSPETRRGEIASLTIFHEQGEPLIRYRLIPVEIVDFGQPRLFPLSNVDQKHPD